MEVRAVARHVRVSPRKARQVVDMIRGKDVYEALATLKYLPKRSASYVEKLLRSAMANAQHNYDLDVDDLYVATTYVDQGATWKRIRPRAQGRAARIRKRTSHITIILNEKEG